MNRRAISEMTRAILVLALVLTAGYLILYPFFQNVLTPVFGFMAGYASAAVFFVFVAVIIWLSWKFIGQSRP